MLARIYNTLLLLLVVLVSACENDLKDVEKITSKSVVDSVDKSTGVEIIYSDSANVKAKLITPELLNYKTVKPYYEMKKGVTVIMYDDLLQETTRITSDNAIQRQNEKVVELRKNVVVKTTKGETFKSEELIWDQNTRRCYSNKLVSIITNNQTIYGSSFWAKEDFSYYEITQSTGNFDISSGK
ncbi:MAG TPA: LPS export ABC transporter periplasmic protein LptC [Sphingobacteriaceae bacterium]|nr:LPS export ABC transporter periplasmic protein LptC [Sphingobacteriaceae bacterium]